MKQKILYTLLVIVVFFVGAATNFFLFDYYYVPKTENINTVVNEIKIEETMIEEAIEKAYDAVVVVETIKNNVKVATGTGFVYNEDDEYGYIITNNHVISEGTDIVVIFSTGKRVEATLLGGDAFADIAVLSVPKQEIITIAEIGTIDNIRLGSTVFAIGAPVSADYSGTVTRGIISGKDRLVTISLSGQSSNDWIMRVIQTDAAINPGNSGGPLLNVLGEVIGINSLKLINEKIEGIGFAIPIDDAMQYVEKLAKGETIPRPVLGVHLLDLNETYALFVNNINIDEEIESGVVIQKVIDGYPAGEVGLKKGDIILKIGGNEVKNKAQLRYELYKYDIGTKINITYYRDNETHQIDIILSSREDE